MYETTRKFDMGTVGLVQKRPLKDNPLQTDPATADTTEEDPTVDALKKPVVYADIMQRRNSPLKLKTPGAY